MPAYESTVTSQLWRDGAVMLGKLNCDEFAMGSANETSVFSPAIKSLWSVSGEADLAAGGSSGGSASSVAADHWWQPAQVQEDLILAASSILRGGRHETNLWALLALGDCGAGIFTGSGGAFYPRCGANLVMFTLWLGMMPERLHTSADTALPDLQAALQASVKGMKIGISKYVMDGMDEAITALSGNRTGIAG